eukprot:CAMPEP_0171370292 /NCGR_PEP_ID=MMETSP0879-20121228/7938_1 /TAXON_ID=67004 /ORGANISM="Thalassiosira weissflogii, Strain CCMP1336" /LENGTH=474 /DNA_ID=CAMNT_0011878757 /DNA_START=70 /DNA_END=1494 /DNA_ORIENTATION=+
MDLNKIFSRSEEAAGIPTSRSKIKKHSRPKFNESELDRVNHQIQIFMKKIKSEKERIKYLNDQICLQEANALERKRRMGGDGISDRESKEMIEKQCRMLEDRLNHSLVAFNTKVAENKELRRKIDEMRQIRCRYDEIYTRLEFQYQWHTKRTEEVLISGKKKIQLRENAKRELEATEKQLKLEETKLLEEQNELKSLQEELRLHDSTISRFLRDDSSIGRPQTTVSCKSFHGPGSDSDDLDFDDNDFLDDQLKRLIERTGIRNADSLIERISSTKDKNFSRFSYITQDLESEIAQLETQIVKRENELKRLKAKELVHGNDRKREWEKMEAEKAVWINKISEMKHKFEEESKKWENVKMTLKSCVLALSFHRPQNDDTIEITSGNVMDYLALIEKKISELKFASRANNGEYTDGNERSSPSLRNASDDYLVALSSANPPTDFDSTLNDSDDDDERPLTIEEIRLGQSKIKHDCHY